MESKAEVFAFDGCHKIYLIEDENDIEEAREYGYDIYRIERLESAFRHSCPMRFIQDWNFKKSYIKQLEFIDVELKEKENEISFID